MVEPLALSWVLGGHRNEIGSVKKHSSNRELLDPKSELSCRAIHVSLSYLSKAKEKVRFFEREQIPMWTQTIPVTPLEECHMPDRIITPITLEVNM